MPHLVCCYGNRVGMALQRGIEVLGKKRVGWGQQRRTAGSWHLLSVLVALKPQMHLVGVGVQEMLMVLNFLPPQPAKVGAGLLPVPPPPSEHYYYYFCQAK